MWVGGWVGRPGLARAPNNPPPPGVLEIHSYDHMPVSRGYMQAQYPLLMAGVLKQ